jgi:hypothetical protein
MWSHCIKVSIISIAVTLVSIFVFMHIDKESISQLIPNNSRPMLSRGVDSCAKSLNHRQMRDYLEKDRGEQYGELFNTLKQNSRWNCIAHHDIEFKGDNVNFMLLVYREPTILHNDPAWWKNTFMRWFQFNEYTQILPMFNVRINKDINISGSQKRYREMSHFCNKARKVDRPEAIFIDYVQPIKIGSFIRMVPMKNQLFYGEHAACIMQKFEQFSNHSTCK